MAHPQNKLLFAHKVQLSDTVGGTLHIEPTDTPRAGEPALAWFALTRQGGQVVPFDNCNCSLAVYQVPVTPDTSPLLTPSLTPVSAENYQGIPGAEITFPSPGAYELKISGEPTSDGQFDPFELTFEVTVATGKSVAQTPPEVSPSPTPSPTTTSESFVMRNIGVFGVMGAIALVLIIIVIGRVLAKSQTKE